MEAVLTRVADYLWTQSWQIALLVAAIALASWVLRNRSAHVRYLLWLLVLAKCLTPPVVQVPLAVLPDRAPVAITPVTPAAASHEGMTEEPVPERPRPTASSPAPHLLPTTPLSPARESLHLTTAQWLAVGWLAGVTLFLCVALTKAAHTILWLRHERRPLRRTGGDFLEETFRSLRIKRPPRVWLMADVGQPFVWGFLRGDIYLPDRFARIENHEHRRDVLTHEISHVLRFDAAVNILQIVAQGFFWFHPLVWWANQRIRREREKCCDEMAVAHLGAKPKEYSAAIVNTLIQAQESTRPVPSLAVAGPVKNIEERIRAMLRPGKEFYKRPSVPAAAMVVLLSLLAVPTTVVLTVKAAAQAPTDSAAAYPIFENPTNLGPSVNSSSQEYDPSISADELEFYFNSDRPGGLGKTDLWVATRKTKADPWGKAVNLGPTVNSPAGDKGPCISADGLSLYFSSDRPGGYSGLDLWVTTRESKTDPWGAPVNLGPAVNSAADEHTPCISSDGMELYFSGHPGQPESARPGGSGESDLWVTTRKTTHGPWGTPVNLGPTVNSPFVDASPSLSGDGLSLYFRSGRPAGSGAPSGGAIWVTKRKSKSDPWGMPVKLGPGVNAFYYATGSLGISKDGSTLYFSSWVRPGGIGRSDIWQVTLAKSTPESRAQYQLAASLYDAVTAGDLQQVRSLLAKGANANAKDGIGNTALFFAILSHDPAMVELLVTKGADVNLANVFRTAAGNYSLAQLAVGHGNLDTMRLLVDHGAKLDAKDQDGWTALRHAAAGGKRDLVEFFVSKGVDLPAFHLAACMGDLTRVKGLLEQGANVDATDELGWTPLSWATCLRRTEVAKLLVANGANVQVVAKDGTTPLLRAVQAGDRELVDLILSKGADVNTKDKQGRTMLGFAAALGHREVAELLIAKGADVNARDNAMGWALANDRVAIAKMLAAKGAEGVTLPVAARIGDLARVKSLLEQGADVNAEDFRGATALHYAARGGFQEMVEVLLAKGANVNAIAYGSSAAEHALGNGRPAIVELLSAKGAADVPPLHLAVHKRDLAHVRDLLEKGADVKQRTQHGIAPLHVAARTGHTEIAALLLDKGANVNAADNLNWTPLHYAAENGHKDVVELLLAKGADAKARNGQGRMPLWYAREEAHASVVDLLLKHGARE
jgi:ankyrin repeat protein/beta-lactamase regulating signal transducer with metallopeptidase domain